MTIKPILTFFNFQQKISPGNFLQTSGIFTPSLQGRNYEQHKQQNKKYQDTNGDPVFAPPGKVNQRKGYQGEDTESFDDIGEGLPKERKWFISEIKKAVKPEHNCYSASLLLHNKKGLNLEQKYWCPHCWKENIFIPVTIRTKSHCYSLLAYDSAYPKNTRFSF